MKKYLLMIICITFFFIGCGTDGIYNVSKTVYKGGKAVVQELPLNNEVKEKLGKVDSVATTYDEARTAVRSELDNQGNDQGVATFTATKP